MTAILSNQGEPVEAVSRSVHFQGEMYFENVHAVGQFHAVLRLRWPGGDQNRSSGQRAGVAIETIDDLTPWLQRQTGNRNKTSPARRLSSAWTDTC